NNPLGLGFGIDDAVMPVVPMFHANAWGYPYLATMQGGKIVYPGPHLDPDSLLENMEQERVTWAAGVPTIWMGILARLDADPGRWTADGWFRTGDIVSIHPRGFIQIKDRSKDVIKSGGEWISSVDLENALMAHPAVAESAVIAVPDDKWGERPLAAVVLREGASATADELREFLAPSFAKWCLPDRIEFVAEIPKTSVGKFRKIALREQFAA